MSDQATIMAPVRGEMTKAGILKLRNVPLGRCGGRGTTVEIVCGAVQVLPPSEDVTASMLFTSPVSHVVWEYTTVTLPEGPTCGTAPSPSPAVVKGTTMTGTEKVVPPSVERATATPSCCDSACGPSASREPHVSDRESRFQAT